MQDLEVINRQNARATEEHAIASRAAGKFGVAKYSGLNFFTWADFDTEAQANAAASDWIAEGAGHRATVHNPV